MPVVVTGQPGPCCGGKCLNVPIQGWNRVSNSGTGGAGVSQANGIVTITASANGAVILQDSSVVAFNPANDFNFSVRMQNPGVGEGGAGLGTSDAANKIVIQFVPNPVLEIKSPAGTRIRVPLAGSNDGAFHTYTVSKKGRLITAVMEGVATVQYTLEGEYPTVPLAAEAFAGAGAGAVASVINFSNYCFSKGA